MSSESHETSKEREFGGGVKESPNKRALCDLDTPKLGKSTFAADTNRDDLIRSHMQRSKNYVAYDNLKSLYICKVDESKLNSGRKIYSEEQPLDFSSKPNSAVRKDEFPQNFKKLALNSTITSQSSQENSANSSDYVNDSEDEEEKPECFTVYSHANLTKLPRVPFHTNGSRNTSSNVGEENLHRMNGRLFKYAKRNEYERNGLKEAISSGSEDELHTENSHNSRSYEQNGVHTQFKSVYHDSAEEKRSPLSQFTVSEMPPISNRHSENGSDFSIENNDRFHIQGILKRDIKPTIQEELSEPQDNLTTQQRTSPQSSFRHFGKEENPPSKSITTSHTVNIPPGSSSPSQSTNIPPASSSPIQSTNIPPGSSSPTQSIHFPPRSSSPSRSLRLPPGVTSHNHPMHLLPARFPLGATEKLYESNGMISAYLPTVYSPNSIANLMKHNLPGEASDYSRIYSYPPGTMFQPPFNPMHTQPYQQALMIGQDQQRQKKQRPFKEIDPSVLMQQLPITQTEVTLNLGPSPSSSYNYQALKYTECNGSTSMGSSPQRLSPDSPSLANGSYGNESMQLDTNDEPGRKKIRRIPPEEKDEKYLAKRRKNNLAAKKSRDERRRKEDILAISVKSLMEKRVQLEALYKATRIDFENSQHKLEMIMGNLLMFREKLDGRMKETFEETFKLFLP